MSEVTIVLPAYREEATIEEAVSRVIKCLEDDGITFLIRVVVDGPGDRTAEIVRGMKDPRITVTELDRNFGKGRAVRTGLSGCSTPYVGYMDADLDLHPRGFAEALRALQNAPTFVCGAVGSKMHPLSNVDYPPTRRMASRIYKMIVKLAFSLSLSDTQTGLKVFRRNAVEEVLPFLERNGFEFDLELLTLLSQRQCAFIEVPVELNFHFSSTISARSGVRTIVSTLLLALQLRLAGNLTRRIEPR